MFSKRKTIGVFISKQFKHFDDVFYRTVAREGKRLDYDVVFLMTAGNFQEKSDYDIQEKNIVRFAPFKSLDGIIAVPSTYAKSGFRDLLFDALRKRADCPVVIVREESDEFNCVYTDNRGAIQPLIRHLIEDHGLSRICFQTGDRVNSELDARLATFRQEMEDHGLPVSEKSICTGNLRTNCGMRAYDAFFSDPDNLPEAVVCANDYMAMGLIRVLREKGYRVPQDVIVTGFDNLSNWCMDVPALTTIQPDYEGMAAGAMAILDRKIRGEADGLLHIQVRGTMIRGESCGCGKRAEDYYKQASEDMSALLEDEEKQDTIMNNLSIDLAACDDLTSLHEVLISARTNNPIVRDHYMCLFGEAGKLMEETSSKACLVHAIRDHQDFGMPMISFDREKILPAMAERSDEAQTFFVKLLHQKGHNFGYSVFQYDEGKVPSRCFVQTNVLLSIAIENMHRKKELLDLYEERKQSSITDLMTGLLNRRGLMERMEMEWPGLIGHPAAFISIDMDRLKSINDVYGHAAGDYAIRLVGEAIRHVLPGNAAGVRMGGDEFLVFMPDAGEVEAAAFVSDFETALAEMNRIQDRSFTVSASSGVAVFRLNDQDTIEGCIQASDKKLYQAKEYRHAQMDRQ